MDLLYSDAKSNQSFYGGSVYTVVLKQPQIVSMKIVFEVSQLELGQFEIRK